MRTALPFTRFNVELVLWGGCAILIRTVFQISGIQTVFVCSRIKSVKFEMIICHFFCYWFVIVGDQRHNFLCTFFFWIYAVKRQFEISVNRKTNKSMTNFFFALLAIFESYYLMKTHRECTDELLWTPLLLLWLRRPTSHVGK